MTVALVVLAVVAVLAAGVALAQVRRARQLQRTLDSTTTELDDARSTVAARDAELAAATDRATAAEATANAAETTIAGMVDERRTLDARATEVVADRDRLLADVERLTADHDDASAQVVALEEQLAEMAARADRFREDHRGGLDATALWNLELARAHRTWQHSVAVSPDQPSPFADTDDPLGVAVGVEVAALREEVGVAMELRWSVTVDDLARRLLVLRIVQELLSLSSRVEEAVVLSAEDGPDGTIVLHLDVPDGNAPMGAAHLDGVEHLLTIDATDGLRVVVH